MTENDVLVFLLSLAILLGTAKGLGELARAAGLPLVVGEIAAGILLGPTALGRFAPHAHEWLFGAPSPAKMIGAFTSVAVVLLLVVAGIEVDLEVVKRRGKSALFTSVLGILLPLGGGVLLGYLLPDSDLVQPDHRSLFAFFIGVALSISALPVIAKTLLDLGLFKTEVGLLVMTAAMINDLVGWLAFSLLVGPFQPVFGGFVVGVILGVSRKLKTRTRVVIESFVMRVFAPVFFASLGLRVDFGRAFDLRLCVLVFSIATVAKVVGGAIGARAGGLPWKEAGAVGFGLNARGAMEIILALLALDAGLIKEQLFVALVVMALGTSLLSGPVMKRLLYGRGQEEEVVTLLREGAFVAALKATSPSDAIHELVRSLGSLLTGVKRDAREAVLERERTAPTGLGDEVAIPHAAVEGLTKPILALGLSPRGIDFDAPDGRPARVVFLLLMPPRFYEREVRILASISRSVFDERARSAVLRAETLLDAADALAKSAARIRESMKPSQPSLADM